MFFEGQSHHVTIATGLRFPLPCAAQKHLAIMFMTGPSSGTVSLADHIIILLADSTHLPSG